MGKENSLEDLNLWKRLVKDDRHALSLLFQKYYNPLLNYGMRIIPRFDLVKDSIQELFYTVWKSRSRLNDVEKVAPYLYASMRRILFRQAEIEQTRHDRDRSYSQENNRKNLNKEEEIIIEELSQETTEKLEEALEELSGRPKEAAFLKFYGGLSNDEISEVMGVNKQTVYNYINTAVTTLEETLCVSLTG